MYIAFDPGRVPVRVPGLGDVTASTDLLGLTGSSISPFLLVGGALLVWFLLSKVRGAVSSRPRRRVRKSVSSFNTAVLAAGAGAGGYLLGKYSGL
jgi:hypothetical protein